MDVSFKVDERTGRIIMMGAMDNLVKGAAGQAVQNMNIMFGLPENEAYNKYQCSHKTNSRKISYQIAIGKCKLACKDAYCYLVETKALALVLKGTRFLLKEIFV